MELLQQFRQHCTERKLVQPQDRLLLAVSGGLDSCILLDLFCRLRNEWALQLAVAHVNHQLRREESDADEAFVKALAERFGLPFFSQRIEVQAYAGKNKLSLETAARELRYQVLETFCRNWGARAMVTAHTLDDQAETILDHILRGSGLKGLGGMATLAEIQIENLQMKILRPLLPFTREQLEEYAHSHPLRWREDRTNAERQFRRNRIRHELLPLLRTRFNPQIAQSLQHLANIAAAAETYLRAEAEARLLEIIKEQQSDKIILDLELFWKYFPIIQSFVVRAVIRRLADRPVEPTFAETARLLALLQKANDAETAAGKRHFWRRQIEVLVDHDGVVFRRLPRRTEGKEREDAPRATRGVKIGERRMISETGMALLIERKDLPRDWRQQVNPNSQFVDAEKVRGELSVRFPRAGDRFVPLRANDGAAADRGTKKLSDFFTDLKVPLHQRRTTPVLEADQIIWVCGYRIDNRFKITPATRSALHLRLLPSDEQRMENSPRTS